MRRLVPVIAVLAFLAVACGDSGGDTTTAGAVDTTEAVVTTEPVEAGLDLAGVKATAIQYVLGDSSLSQKDLVYVAGPSLELWDQWCGFDTGEPGEDPHDENQAACDVLDATSFDLPAVYPAGSDSADEIAGALSHAEVEFIEEPESVIEPFEEGMMIAPIRNDAGLITFGVPIEAEGKIYLPVDAHGSGWLFELTPSESDTGWEITPIAEYIV